MFFPFITVFLLSEFNAFLCAKRARQLAGMVHMRLAAERARFVDGYLCIQNLISGIVGGNAPIIEYLKIRTFIHFVFIRAYKCKFHFLFPRQYE